MSDQPETLSAVTTNGTDAVLGMEYNGAEGHETDTVASIIAEMRDTRTDTPPSALSDLADRIEAAAERERDEDRRLAGIAESDEAFARCARCDRPERAPGNAAALREALTALLRWVDDHVQIGAFDEGSSKDDIRREWNALATAQEAARAALSAPARICDKYPDRHKAICDCRTYLRRHGVRITPKYDEGICQTIYWLYDETTHAEVYYKTADAEKKGNETK